MRDASVYHEIRGNERLIAKFIIDNMKREDGCWFFEDIQVNGRPRIDLKRFAPLEGQILVDKFLFKYLYKLDLAYRSFSIKSKCKNRTCINPKHKTQYRANMAGGSWKVKKEIYESLDDKKFILVKGKGKGGNGLLYIPDGWKREGKDCGDEYVRMLEAEINERLDGDWYTGNKEQVHRFIK